MTRRGVPSQSDLERAIAMAFVACKRQIGLNWRRMAEQYDEEFGRSARVDRRLAQAHAKTMAPYIRSRLKEIADERMAKRRGTAVASKRSPMSAWLKGGEPLDISE